MQYSLLCEVLLKAATGEEFDKPLKDLETSSIYKDDINFSELRSQLALLGSLCKGVDTIGDMVSWFKSRTDIRVMLAAVENLLKLILTLPATNAVSERSFSALRRVKTYLRSSMLQPRLNHAMLTHVHKARVDAVDGNDVLREYVLTRPNRESLFSVEGATK
jgi:hypothetical protein